LTVAAARVAMRTEYLPSCNSQLSGCLV